MLILSIILFKRILMTESSKLNLLSPLRTIWILSPRTSPKKSKNDTWKSFWRSISKGSLMAECYNIGRVLEISFTFKPISDKDIH
jgi:hypothetical protein